MLSDINKFAKERHNPYFSRWFSAIEEDDYYGGKPECHNPYFSRWFSAIMIEEMEIDLVQESQSLF